MTATATQYRVFHLTKALRSKIKTDRAERTETVETYYHKAVDDNLKGITDALIGLGIVNGTDRGPVRIPITEKTLAALAKAKDSTGIDMATLLNACLSQRAKSTKPARRNRKAGAK